MAIARPDSVSSGNCGLVAVRAILSFLHASQPPSAKDLREALKTLGFPKGPTGSSAAHLGWLLRRYGGSAAVLMVNENLSEIWSSVSAEPAGANLRLRGKVRRGSWANSAKFACSELARSRSLYLAEPRITPFLTHFDKYCLILRVDSSAYFGDPADVSAHFIPLVPSSKGYRVIDTYGAESVRGALNFDWRRWSNDLVVVPLTAAGWRKWIGREVKADAVSSIV